MFLLRDLNANSYFVVAALKPLLQRPPTTHRRRRCLPARPRTTRSIHLLGGGRRRQLRREPDDQHPPQPDVEQSGDAGYARPGPTAPGSSLAGLIADVDSPPRRPR